jgi:hypothetical protein
MSDDEVIDIFPEGKPEERKRKRVGSKGRSLRGKNPDTLTPRELNLLAYNQLVINGEMTLAEATMRSGFAVKPKNAGQVGAQVIGRIKEKLSRNEHLQEILGLKGASIDDAATALAESLRATKVVPVKAHAGNLEGVREVPDHMVREKAAEFVIQAHNAMPEKKIEKEIITYEERVTRVQELKEKGAEGIEMIKKLIVQRQLESG